MEFGTGELIGLSFVTCGIFGLVRFYQSGSAYRRIAPGAAPNFEWQFWTYIVTAILGGATVEFGIGFLLLIASIVIGALMLAELCEARGRIAQQLGVVQQLESSTTHVTWWVMSQLLACLIFPVFVQVMKYFADHNTVARAWRASRGT